MRRSPRVYLCLLLLVLPACSSGKPADLPSLTIEKVRVGIPAGPDSTRSRPGAWCPVYVTLKAGSTPITRDSLRLVVKTTDADDTPFRYTVAVPAMNAEDQQTVLTYTRPGTTAGEIEVQVATPDGRLVQTMPKIQRNVNRNVLEPKEPLLVAVGSRTLRPDPAVQNEDGAEEKEEEIKSKNLAFLENLEQMPDQWFGYDAADVVVLTTGKAAFIGQLLDDTTNRREALVEWVHRGGKLVVSVGKNQQIVSRLLDKTGLITCQLDAPITLPFAQRLQEWARVPGQNQPLRGLELTVVHPGKGAAVLVQEGEGDKPRRPVLVEASCGLGRVVLAAFDVEANPFASWAGRKEFWEQLQKELRVRSEAAPKPGDNPNLTPRSELLAEIQRNLESFQDVPTISFGWVALFILFYIGLVGPLDYFILKKVFKRLELTWVTFPATVLLVSATAYLSAYYLKGDDLHVKKLDLVEIDLGEKTACGTTWFTLFSPQIRNYTLGVEPVSPEWVAPPNDANRPVRQWTTKTSATANRPIHPTTLAVLASPEQGRRSAAAALSPNPYDCTEAATGLEKVPIPIWATRAFTASWTAPLSGKPPIEAPLRLPRRRRARPGVTPGRHHQQSAGGTAKRLAILPRSVVSTRHAGNGRGAFGRRAVHRRDQENTHGMAHQRRGIAPRGADEGRAARRQQ